MSCIIGPRKPRDTTTNGTDIVNVISHIYGSDFQHDELETEEEVEVIGNFLQDLQDWGNIIDEIEEMDRTRLTFSIAQQVKELERLGFYVFATKQIRK